MKASRTILAAAGLILAAGLPFFGATGAGAALRPPLAARPHVSVWRSAERHAIDRRRDRFARGRGNGLDLFGDIGPTEGETPTGEQAEAPQVAIFFPPIPAFGRVAAEFVGPKIIEIGSRAPAPRRARLPVVIYGDVSR